MIRRAILGTVFALATATAAQASVEISSNPTHNMNCADGICTPTAKNADLNAADLANMLATSDVKVVTGAGAVTITVSQSFSWTSTHRLTLDAYYNVSFRAPVVVAGQGAVTIVTNDGGTGGDLLFFPGASLDFWDASSSLIVGGHSYRLEKRLVGLADDIAANPNGFFALANNYDAARPRPYRAPPIATPLTGSFEGLGHTVSNLNIEPKNTNKHPVPDVGLFAGVAAGGLVRDILIVNGKIVNYTEYAATGLLAGYNAGTVIHSGSSGTAQQSYRSRGDIGGLVGSNSGTIVQSYAAVSVSIGDSAIGGGLAGWNGGTVDGCYATGSSVATDSGASGGLVGQNYGLDGNIGLITRSHATGNVSGFRAGGLVDDNRGGTITLSFATGNVSGRYDGGLVAGSGYGNAMIDSSYATGQVTADGGYYSGGLVGEAYGSGATGSGTIIQNSYSTGMVTGTGLVGGAVGYDFANGDTLNDIYWDLDTSGISDPSHGAGNIANDPGITGLTDAQLKSGLPPGFDPQVWGQNAAINNGYPYLLPNPPPQ